MHKAKKRVAKRYFDKWALNYDESVFQHLVFRSAHKMFFKEIESYGNERLKILDAGCGTGEFVHTLADHFKESEVHGVDISKTMIEKANLKMKNGNVKFEIGDAEELPYEDNAFDVITCSHSFHHYPNKERAVAEMYRVLKPEGRLMVIDGCRDVLLGRVIFDIVERMERHVRHLFGEEFRELFRRNGFNNIVQKRFNFIPLLLTIGAAIKEPQKHKNNFVKAQKNGTLALKEEG